jgi:hypothetical protein
MIKRILLAVIFLVVVSIGVSQTANADIVTLTFEGVGDEASINDFYNGGTDSMGNSGINYGINFSSNSLGLIASDSGGSGNFIGALAPSPVTVAFFLSGAADTMNVAAGFTIGFSFFYDAPTTGGNSVFVYDALGGAGGGGNVLGSLLLPSTGEGYPAHLWVPIGVTFSGTAYSVDFGGVANQVAFDNVTLGSNIPGGGEVPEPATMLLLGSGLVGLAGYARKRMKK